MMLQGANPVFNLFKKNIEEHKDGKIKNQKSMKSFY